MDSPHPDYLSGVSADVDARDAQGLQVGDHNIQTNIFQAPRWDMQRPAQLPAAVAHFAGRSGELAVLTGLLRGRAEAGDTVIISAGGTAGVGKTALAVYWAHRVAD